MMKNFMILGLISVCLSIGSANADWGRLVGSYDRGDGRCLRYTLTSSNPVSILRRGARAQLKMEEGACRGSSWTGIFDGPVLFSERVSLPPRRSAGTGTEVVTHWTLPGGMILVETVIRAAMAPGRILQSSHALRLPVGESDAGVQFADMPMHPVAASDAGI